MPTKRVTGITATICGAVLLYATAAASIAEARDLRFAIGFPEGSDTHRAAEIYADKMEAYSEGHVSATIYPLTLLNFQEMSGGIQAGIADIGQVLTAYFVSEYPHYNMIGESALLLNLIEADDVTGRMAYVGAMSEFAFHHCPECHDEFAAQNQVFTGSAAGGIYELSCDEPVRSLDEIEGKRLRAPGSHWARWSNELGATPVSMSANEVFEALNQGVVDCVVISAPELTNLGLIDAVTDITTDVPGGTFAGTAIANVNADVWADLGETERESMLRASAEMAAEGLFMYFEQEKEIMADAREADDIAVHEPDDELLERTLEFSQQDMETITSYYAEERGVERSEEMLEVFEALLETWVERVEDVDSAEELGQLYWEHAFSEVDVNQHGE